MVKYFFPMQNISTYTTLDQAQERLPDMFEF